MPSGEATDDCLECCLFNMVPLSVEGRQNALETLTE